MSAHDVTGDGRAFDSRRSRHYSYELLRVSARAHTAKQEGKLPALKPAPWLCPCVQEVLDDPVVREELTEALSAAATAVLDRPPPDSPGGRVPELRWVDG